MLLYVHRSEMAYRGRGNGGGGVREAGAGGWGVGVRKSERLVRAFRPGKTEEAVDHRQNNYVKTVGIDLAIA